MLERDFNQNIKVEYKPDEKKEDKDKKRSSAIREHFTENTVVSKPKFLQKVKDIDLPNKEAVIEKINQIDFSNANPRNNTFMNELAFAGQSVMEGFLETFHFEVDYAVDRYNEQYHIIEQKNVNNESRFFLGKYEKGKLKRYGNYEKQPEPISKLMEKAKEQSIQQKLDKQKQTQKIQQAQSLQRDSED